MRNQHLNGDTNLLDRLNLPSGQLAVDTERKALRVYDGALRGGYEVLGVRAYEPTPPGPTELIAGDLETGFYGEVDPAVFISYGELSTLVGLSAGALHNGEESLWLKFSMDGSPAYVAKQSIRYSTSWDQLNAQDLVFGRTVEIMGLPYQVRLMTGLVNPNTYEAGGEWNRLMYPIHVVDPNQQGWGINYTNADLGVASGNGRRNWTQETHPTNPTIRVNRGNSSVMTLTTYSSSDRNTWCGWRPLLIPID